MTPDSGVEPIERLAQLVEGLLGLDATLSRREDLAAVLAERLKATGCSHVEEYGALLRAPDRAREEATHLAARLTVGETSFFREQGHFEALMEHVVPARLGRRVDDAPIRVLSIGCSSGEEPYSVAIAARAALGASAGRVLIQAIDANPTAIERARRGRYSPWALRSTTPELRERWFRRAQGAYELVTEIRESVLFEVRNLLDDDAAFWQLASADVILCRNVLIYFSERQIEAAIARFSDVLDEGGVLFLGHSEMIRDLSGSFETLQSHGTFYHRRTRAAARTRPAASAAADRHAEADSNRNPLLAASPQMFGSAGGSPIHRDRTLADATALFRQEKFADALALIDAVGADAGTERVTLELLRASILANLGSFAGVEAACGRVLEQDPRCAAAYYLIGLCHEHRGHVEEAALHHRRAVEVDPAFSMSHLRLGVLARKRGDPHGARRWLEMALALLPRERFDTLGLLGGGFCVDALVSLCRSELRACGAPA